MKSTKGHGSLSLTVVYFVDIQIHYIRTLHMYKDPPPAHGTNTI